MLTFWGAAQRYCDNVSRRNFLQLGAFGAGLTLADVLRARAAQNPAARAGTSQKAAIMIYLPGGPSHLDMYDLKPDAPAEFRGEFKPIKTNVSGVSICEHMPLQARMWDKLAVVRSLVSVDEHSDSLVSTGFSEQVNRVAAHPAFGSVVAKLRADGGNDVPPFVSLRGGGSPGTEPGYLGPAHRPFTPSGAGVENLRLAGGVTGDRLGDRKDLLGKFDTARREIDASGTMKGMDAYAGRAFDMIASGVVRKALDLKHEDPKTRDRYKGVEQFLTARRLVEAGVGCVTLSYGGWDTHTGNFKELKRQLPQLDRGVANLIQDLHDRGMQDDVVTVVWGEFGRTPKINSSDAGRDHWSPVMSALVAGGGLKMGQAVGSTSAKGEYPKERPYKVPHLLATLYRAMGIDPAYTFPNGAGRPMYILDDRNTVEELL
ncbi:hypothetical protein GobsT_75610 [Gemmata obscuriglobus]|uniref:DUF1501 domain-containing protein n=1 Tax=Gemmata obscuriglobus TaxID=114 RepID=A0A2Z3H938_9BACT|nr:DUF1501 domain-containing protein [Gemmata obscuriglobus]AWM41401.1 DUF1501 domain-containing protein [Gemmata obscuriglobus]QEG32702.1 hypothetical protein GobsT_75610 [Gemmata obscuriglobus]VTS12060.1 hypothetical protein : Putative uncharacterized protein OS=uncultured Acidobacteria bacterium A2 PE=4 SV=1: DUF1501 [Gemmata obscuriglobus UQM 2246]